MIYLLAIILPPVALLLRGKFGAFLLNLLLCLFGYIPGVIHAILVINSADAEKRNNELIKAINTNSSK